MAEKRPAGAGDEQTGETTEWHALGVGDVFERIGASPEGLDGPEVDRRREEYGPNRLPLKKPVSLAGIVLRQFLSPLIYVLIAAGAISAAIGDEVDAFFIFFVVLLNAALGTFQEYRAEKSAEALQGMLTTYTRVTRDGRRVEVDSSELVPGDMVHLQSGNRVPADIRLTEVNNFRVDESVLTGESEASEKSPGALDADISLGDRANMAFQGTVVDAGRATGIVVQTGGRTEFGLIAETATTGESGKPPLVQRMERFSRVISLVVLGVGALLALVSVARGVGAAEAFLLAVALAVSAIPEGLPVGLTVALSRASSKMARRNVIVKQLAAVESLGSCTCIASDKTGTFTVNRQTARVLLLPDGQEFEVSGEGYSGEGEVRRADGTEPDERSMEILEELATAAAVNNDAALRTSDGEWEYSGDEIDVALLALGYKLGVHPERARAGREVIGAIPFESERKYSASLFAEDGRRKVAVKGGTEVVAGFCERMAGSRGPVAMDSRKVHDQALELAGRGYRVISVAEAEVGEAPREGFGEEDMPPLTFLGLVGLIDPIRPEAVEAVRECKRAGIRVIMITGDHPATALAIARELELAREERQVVTGRELEELSEADDGSLAGRVQEASVFARVAPIQKVEIVETLIEGGDFVAVTGDGVNDAPALRKANIGVAMGSGTDVAKDTASIIITDDNFASIVAGVEEGRFAYDNIRKIIWLLVGTGFAEVVLFSLVIFLGLPLALVAVQILWLNLVTNGIQHIALTMEKGEPRTMQKPPRSPSEGVFNRLMLGEVGVAGLTIGLVTFVVWLYLLYGTDLGEVAARNYVLLLMVFFENVQVFACRSEYESAFRVPVRNNYFLFAAVLGAQGIHIAALYLPFLQRLLGTAPVAFLNWLLLLALALSTLLTSELFKFGARRTTAAAEA